MKPCKLLQLIGIIGILALFLFPRNVSASEIFSDNFSTLSTDYWYVNVRQGGQVNIIDNSYLRLSSSNSTSFPYVYLKNSSLPNNNYVVEIKYRFMGNYNYGSGIIFSDNLLPYFTNERLNVSNTLFQIWPDANSRAWINSSICPQGINGCVYPHFAQISSSNFGLWNTLRIELLNDVYSVYQNDNQIFVSSPTTRRFNYIWFGNPEKTGAVLWPSVDIDYFKIYTREESQKLALTVIVPGMGASWDFDALLNGADDTEWKIPDFVKVYDGLINSFDNTDEYTLNQNLFVFTYDWRKPIDLIADDLKNYVDDLPLETGQKINFVGHSMGGLVARSYAQKFYTDNKVNKLFLLGAPNNGTVKAYGTWEGAEIWDDAWWSKAALAITSHLGANLGETQIESIRRIVPSIKDLLPTNDFIYLNGLVLPWNNLSQKNTYLKGLNDDYQKIDNRVTNIVSDDVSSKQYINAEPRSLTDGLLDKWEDGKPKEDNPFQFAPGDGTVTYGEAKGPFSDNVDGAGGHGDLVTSVENIKLLFREIGLDESKAIPSSMESIDFENVLTAILRSPGRLEVCDTTLLKCNEQLGYYFPEYKLFILPGYNQANLVVRVYEEGLGNYSLHLGNISNKANWTVVNNSLENDGQVDYYNIKGMGDDLLVTKDETGPTTPFITGFTNPEVTCDGVTNEHNITVNWTNSEDESGVVGYEYHVDYPIGDKRGQWTAFLKSLQYRGSLNEGIHHIKVRAKDRAGNLSEWSNICSLTADWTAPVVNILSPSQGTYLPSKLPELNYTVKDNFDIDPEITVSGYSKENGDHTISIIATDKAGNVGSATVTYTVQAPPSNKTQCTNGGWRLFTLSQFRNQGECVSFVERSPIARSKYFWWI